MSHTGYIIMYRKCLLVWASKLLTKISLTTTKAEYISLSKSLRESIPLMGLLREIQKYFEVAKNFPKRSCTVFEDNNSCICLLRLLAWTLGWNNCFKISLIPRIHCKQDNRYWACGNRWTNCQHFYKNIRWKEVCLS